MRTRTWRAGTFAVLTAGVTAALAGPGGPAGCGPGGSSRTKEKRSGASQHRTPPTRPETPNPPVDCNLLERALRHCGLHVAAALDPGLPEKVKGLSKALQPSVLRGIRDGLVFRVVSPCRQHRGTMPQTGPVVRCLDAYRKALSSSKPESKDRAAPGKKKPGPDTTAPSNPCRTLAICLARLSHGKDTASSNTARPRPGKDGTLAPTRPEAGR